MIYSILLQDPPRKNLQLEEMFFVHQTKRRRRKLLKLLKPNLNSIRKILGGDGTDQQRKVVEENTGLIPKYYKVIFV